MRLVAIADDEPSGLAAPAAAADVLVSLGDLHDAAIARAMARHRPRHTVAVKGNHDSLGSFASSVEDLHLRVVTFGGVRFGGFGGCWRYKPRGHHLFEQEEVERLLADFPLVDVFIAHNSPAGIHERDGDVHQGFRAFAAYVKRARPRVFLHGHQHVEATTVLGDTLVLGVFGERMITLD